MTDLGARQLLNEYERTTAISKVNGIAFKGYLTHGLINPDMEYFWMFDADFYTQSRIIKGIEYREDKYGRVSLEVSKNDLVRMRLAYKGAENFYDIFNRQDKKQIKQYMDEFLRKKGISIPIWS